MRLSSPHPLLCVCLCVLMCEGGGRRRGSCLRCASSSKKVSFKECLERCGGYAASRLWLHQSSTLVSMTCIFHTESRHRPPAYYCKHVAYNVSVRQSTRKIRPPTYFTANTLRTTPLYGNQHAQYSSSPVQNGRGPCTAFTVHSQSRDVKVCAKFVKSNIA